ncbi:MAG: stress response protein [Desulfobacterales bacterium]|nr:MAG: stress response protein [Desulfobacterales bacterium]
MELRQKGTKADIGAFKQIRVALRWTSSADLDLMAFYRTRDGREGGVYSDNYAGGSLGSLNEFPFIELSGDAGIGGAGGDNREELRIKKLDDFEDLYICALNFTDASSGENRTFSDYDASIQIVTDRGETHTISLDSDRRGTVAVICRLSGGFISSELINDSDVMPLEQFRQTIPGAGEFKIASKITLKGKNNAHPIQRKGGGELHINLNWNQTPPEPQPPKGLFRKLMGGGVPSAIDLDLGCLFELENQLKGAIQPLGDSFGAYDYPPYILHLGDDRSGIWAEGENMKINLEHAAQLKRILVYTYIYEGVPQWSSTDAIVTIRAPGQPMLEVPMGAVADKRPFCAVALLEFNAGQIHVTRKMSFHDGHPDCDAMYNWGLRWVAGSKE